jgi:hypothetical protein
MNLAIYCKPGLDTLDENNKNIGMINWKYIQPLLLKNITVLAKKRKNTHD